MIPNNYKIYKNPTVKTVIFQIRFSNLFMIENKIGDFQTEIMERFPESSLIVRRELLFADVGPQFKMEEIPINENLGKKIWQFKSDDNYVLNVQTNSLDITSKRHKSYYINKETNEEGFRDIIQFSVDKFLNFIPIKTLKRIGLRYIDECPLPLKKVEDSQMPILDNEDFLEWYNTSLPLHRFNLNNLGIMKFEADIKRENYNLIYRESIGPKDKGIKLFIDFDAYKENIQSEEYLKVLDEIHKLIHKEWNDTVKEPVKNWMDREEEI